VVWGAIVFLLLPLPIPFENLFFHIVGFFLVFFLLVIDHGRRRISRSNLPLVCSLGFIFVRFYTEITAPTNNSSLGRGPTQSFLFTAEVDR
jgi:hypothetical protein